MANPIDLWFTFDDDTKEIVGKYASRAEAVRAARASGISLLDKGIKTVSDVDGASKDSVFVLLIDGGTYSRDQTIKHQPLAIDVAAIPTAGD